MHPGPRHRALHPHDRSLGRRRMHSIVAIAVVALLLAAVPAYGAGPLVSGTAVGGTSQAASVQVREAAVASVPRIAIVRSEIAQNCPYGNHFFRVDAVTSWLVSEYGQENVTVIGDADLSNVISLRRFDVVVLVRQLAMTRGQRTALRSYAAGGGGVVAVFGAGRWDYVSTRSPQYVPAIKLYPSLVTEWGEVSEVWGVAFYNDPITSSGYHIVGGSASSHPVLQMTARDLGPSTPLDMLGQKDANEYVTIPVGSVVTPLVRYTNAACSGVPVNGSGWAAGWANQYGLGRAVYFGCQLTACPGTQARTLLVNAVRWAGTPQSLTIKTSATSARIASTFTLSGQFSPSAGMVGRTMHVDVRKPASPRWSYSSNRIVYAGAGGAALWQYKYYLKPGMARGTYYFKAVYDGGVDTTQCMSPSVKVAVR